MRCFTNKVLGLLIIALATGVLLSMIMPYWILSALLAALILIIGLLLFKC